MLKKRDVPNFFIVGAIKAGTTSFAEYLRGHPQIYMSPVKEPHYFSSDIDCRYLPADVPAEDYFSTWPLAKAHTLCVRNPEQYEQLFAAAGDAKAIGEASVSYLYSELAPKRISEEIADPRILVFLRNPVQRAYSHFQMDLAIGKAETGNFLKAIELDWSAPRKGWGLSHLYIEFGLYVPQLKRYLQHFPAERVKICLHDDYCRDVRSTLLEILSFLGVDPTLDGIPVEARYAEAWRLPILSGLGISGAYGMLRRVVPGPLRPAAKRLLSRKPRPMRRHEFEAVVPHFREDILELSSMLGRDLSHWLAPPPEMTRP